MSPSHFLRVYEYMCACISLLSSRCCGACMCNRVKIKQAFSRCRAPFSTLLFARCIFMQSARRRMTNCKPKRTTKPGHVLCTRARTHVREYTGTRVCTYVYLCKAHVYTWQTVNRERSMCAYASHTCTLSYRVSQLGKLSFIRGFPWINLEMTFLYRKPLLQKCKLPY